VNEEPVYFGEEEAMPEELEYFRRLKIADILNQNRVVLRRETLPVLHANSITTLGELALSSFQEILGLNIDRDDTVSLSNLLRHYSLRFKTHSQQE